MKFRFTARTVSGLGNNGKAEDTGLEPATHYWATDFESAC